MLTVARQYMELELGKEVVEDKVQDHTLGNLWDAPAVADSVVVPTGFLLHLGKYSRSVGNQMFQCIVGIVHGMCSAVS